MRLRPSKRYKTALRIDIDDDPNAAFYFFGFGDMGADHNISHYIAFAARTREIASISAC